MAHFLEIEEEVIAWGHINILSTHSSTLEVTCVSEISKRADCIIGVSASKGLAEFSSEFKQLARSSTTEIIITLESGDLRDIIHGWGGPELSFSHDHDIVIRKSKFVCPRTLAIHADKAAADIDRKLIEQLLTRNAKLIMKILARGKK